MALTHTTGFPNWRRGGELSVGFTPGSRIGSSINRVGVGTGTVHYGLGWRIDRTPDGDRFYHSGSNSTGFQCYAEFDPATGNGIVIMTNSSSGSPLWRAARAAIDF